LEMHARFNTACTSSFDFYSQPRQIPVTLESAVFILDMRLWHHNFVRIFDGFPLFLLLVPLLCLSTNAQQLASADTAAQELQQLIGAQQAAKASGDPVQVANASQRLTESATQLMTSVSAELARRDLTSSETKQLNIRKQQLRQILGSGFNDWGTAEARQQQYEAALGHFQQAEKWDASTPGIMRNLGTAAFRLEDFTESARALKTAVAEDSDDPRVRLMLAMSLFTLEKFADATSQFAPISDLAMQDARTAYAWAFSLARTNQQQRANQIADNLARRDLSPDVYMLVCQLYTSTENYEHAVVCFQKLAAGNPTMPRVHYQTGATLVHLDRPADAIPELRAELQLNPQDVDAQYYLAYALLQTSQRDEALALLRKVVASQPDYAQAQYVLGKTLLEAGNTNEAIERLVIAAKLDSSADYIHYQLQSAYRRAGRVDDANHELEIYKQIKASHRGAGAAHESHNP
jgi:predicted Zn-dependent protease